VTGKLGFLTAIFLEISTPTVLLHSFASEINFNLASTKSGLESCRVLVIDLLGLAVSSFTFSSSLCFF